MHGMGRGTGPEHDPRRTASCTCQFPRKNFLKFDFLCPHNKILVYYGGPDLGEPLTPDFFLAKGFQLSQLEVLAGLGMDLTLPLPAAGAPRSRRSCWPRQQK